MSVDSSTYIRKLQCCKSKPNVRGPQGPVGAAGESGVGILNMLYFKDIEVTTPAGAGSIKTEDLLYNNALTLSAGLNGFFTENTNEDTNIIFSRLINPTSYGIEIYAHCDLSGSKSDDAIILDLCGTSIQPGFNDKLQIDARTVNLKNGNGITTSVSFGPIMYRITDSDTPISTLVIHTNNKYRFRVRVKANNETISLVNTQLVIKAIKTGIS